MYVNGGARCGKTFLLNTIPLTIRAQGMLALSCATTGFAAELFSGGRTAHNLFGIPVKHEPTDLSKPASHITPNSQEADLVRAASLFV